MSWTTNPQHAHAVSIPTSGYYDENYDRSENFWYILNVLKEIVNSAAHPAGL